MCNAGLLHYILYYYILYEIINERACVRVRMRACDLLLLLPDFTIKLSIKSSIYNIIGMSNKDNELTQKYEIVLDIPNLYVYL